MSRHRILTKSFIQRPLACRRPGTFADAPGSIKTVTKSSSVARQGARRHLAGPSGELERNTIHIVSAGSVGAGGQPVERGEGCAVAPVVREPVHGRDELKMIFHRLPYVLPRPGLISQVPAVGYRHVGQPILIKVAPLSIVTIPTSSASEAVLPAREQDQLRICVLAMARLVR